jgi:hypothetical protein
LQAGMVMEMSTGSAVRVTVGLRALGSKVVEERR